MSEFHYKGRHQYACLTPSKTVQSFKEECDINNVMLRFEQTGILEHVSTYAPQWGDFSDTPSSYQDALAQIKNAEDMFKDLPARVREQFDNNPGKFIDFVENPENTQALIDLGLANLKTPKASPDAEAPTAKASGKAAPAAPETS